MGQLRDWILEGIPGVRELDDLRSERIGLGSGSPDFVPLHHRGAGEDGDAVRQGIAGASQAPPRGTRCLKRQAKCRQTNSQRNRMKS